MEKASSLFSDDQSQSLPYPPADLSPDPADIVAAWPTFPEPIRSGIVAMVRAADSKMEGGDR
jgi:hypothetical protein